MRRAGYEVGLAAMLAVMTLITALWPAWIEGLTGLDPDRGTGELEWLIVVVLLVTTLSTSRIAWRDLRAARAGAPSA
jgi:hypothetical protein